MIIDKDIIEISTLNDILGKIVDKCNEEVAVYRSKINCTYMEQKELLARWTAFKDIANMLSDEIEVRISRNPENIH